MRRAAKRDANEPQVIAALEKVGAVVHPISDDSALDLVVGFRRDLYWIEVKDGNKPPSARKLRPRQIETLAKFAGYRVAVVETPEQALEVIGL